VWFIVKNIFSSWGVRCDGLKASSL
jgi:hypothetical protein